MSQLTDAEKTALITRNALNLTEAVKEFHEGMFEGETWNRLAGQYIVYGQERALGFSAAVELEARVERAWRMGQDIKPVIEEFLRELIK